MGESLEAIKVIAGLIVFGFCVFGYLWIVDKMIGLD